MSKSRINLYSQEFKPVKTLLSLAQLCIVLFCSLLLLIATLTYSNLQYKNAKSAAKQADKQLSIRQDELSKQEALLAAHSPSNALVNQVMHLKQSLNIKDALLKELSSQNFEAKQGYSSLFTALAETEKGPLWLTYISANGNSVNLQGESLSSDAIPVWLIQFKKFPALAGKHFKTMQIWRNEDQHLLFSLTSLDPKKGEKNEQ